MLKLLLNPWFLLSALLAIAGAGAGGIKLGIDYAEGQHAKESVLIEKAGRAAQIAAAEQIAQIKIVNQTNRQVIEREIRTVPDYSACKHSPDGLRAINEALTGRASAPSNSVVPGTSPAG